MRLGGRRVRTGRRRRRRRSGHLCCRRSDGHARKCLPLLFGRSSSSGGGGDGRVDRCMPETTVDRPRRRVHHEQKKRSLLRTLPLLICPPLHSTPLPSAPLKKVEAPFVFLQPPPHLPSPESLHFAAAAAAAAAAAGELIFAEALRVEKK